MEASWIEAKALQHARAKAAILLAAMSGLAIFSAPWRVGFSWTRIAAHRLLERQVRNAHMTVTSAAPATASGGARRPREILYFQKKRYPIS